MLDRVLGGQDEEGRGQGKGLGSDGHLPLLHGLEQGALDLGRSPVDLVGEDEVGEDGALAHGKGLLLLVVDHGADHIRRKQVRGELDAAEIDRDGPAQGLDGERLGEARHALEEDMAVGQQANQQVIHHAFLSNHGLADFVSKGVDEGAGRRDAVRQGLDVGMPVRGRVHGGSEGLTFHRFRCHCPGEFHQQGLSKIGGSPSLGVGGCG